VKYFFKAFKKEERYHFSLHLLCLCYLLNRVKILSSKEVDSNNFLDFPFLTLRQDFFKIFFPVSENCVSMEGYYLYDYVFKRFFQRISGDPEFQISRREFFSTFERREFSFARNLGLTIIAKLLIKYIWDCRNRQFIPTDESVLECLSDKVVFLTSSNNKFLKIWQVSGLFLNNPEIVRIFSSSRQLNGNQYLLFLSDTFNCHQFLS
jgi:hypothetical protein